MGSLVREDEKLHCLIVPFPVQGHINPMLQFSKRLQHEGITITLAPTAFIFNKTLKDAPPTSISVHPISDGYDAGGFASEPNIDLYLDTFKTVGSRTVAELVRDLEVKGKPVDCIIYDAFMPWVLDVAKELGLLAGVFFTMSCAVGNIFYHVSRGALELPVTGTGEVVLPGLPPLQLGEMPSTIADYGTYPPLFKMLVEQFSNITMADWIFCNTVLELEQREVEWVAKELPVKTIGPTIPSMYVDKRLEDDRSYGLSMYQPNTDLCMKWLDDRSDGSVVFVSFGSLAELTDDQMHELAFGLKKSDYPYLWVVRASEEAKLPKDFLSNEKGLVVTWCPQLDVLSHKALGCFVTHCGWNSTLEALTLGVALVGVPVWTDQRTNAKYVSEVWGNGIRAQPDEKGIVREGEVERCVKEVLEGEKGKEIRANAAKWKGIIRKASDLNGSSDRNINDFIGQLSQRSGKKEVTKG